jgi:hypothetical protein
MDQNKPKKLLKYCEIRLSTTIAEVRIGDGGVSQQVGPILKHFMLYS